MGSLIDRFETDTIEETLLASSELSYDNFFVKIRTDDSRLKIGGNNFDHFTRVSVETIISASENKFFVLDGTEVTVRMEPCHPQKNLFLKYRPVTGK